MMAGGVGSLHKQQHRQQQHRHQQQLQEYDQVYGKKIDNNIEMLS